FDPPPVGCHSTDAPETEPLVAEPLRRASKVQHSFLERNVTYIEDPQRFTRQDSPAARCQSGVTGPEFGDANSEAQEVELERVDPLFDARLICKARKEMDGIREGVFAFLAGDDPVGRFFHPLAG